MLRYVVYLILMIVVISMWFVRFSSVIKKFGNLDEGDLVKISGKVTSQPYQKDSKQLINISLFYISTDAFPRYSYGDNLEVTGKLRNKLTKIGETRIWLTNTSIRKVERDSNRDKSTISTLIKRIANFRKRLIRNIAILLPEPHSSLLSGIMLGVKRALPSEFAEALRNTGTLHVVVASGYNVTVVVGVIVFVIVQLLPRQWSIPFIIIGIVVYTIMAGAEPPVVRAAIMAGLSFVAQFLGKQYQGLWSLLVAGIVMALIAPLLVFDVGFQLSVAATAGILMLSPIISFGLRRLMRFMGRSLIEELAVTLGAQIAVLPILLFHFQQVSWLSPITNLIVVFVIPIIMGMGAMLAMLSFISGAIAQVFALSAC